MEASRKRTCSEEARHCGQSVVSFEKLLKLCSIKELTIIAMKMTLKQMNKQTAHTARALKSIIAKPFQHTRNGIACVRSDDEQRVNGEKSK